MIGTSCTLAAALGDGLAPGEAPPSGIPPLTVFAIIGQSNAVGFAADTGGSISTYPAGTQHWTTEGAWANVPSRIDHGPLADGEFRHVGETDPNLGWDRSFAEAWGVANPAATLAFVGAAKGSTSLNGGQWVKGGTAYNQAVARINAAMAAAPVGAVFGGFLWHQGESDAGATATAAYRANLDQMIADLRNDVTAAGPTTPFVAGAISRCSGAVFFSERLVSIQQSVGNRVTHTATAMSPPDSKSGPDNVHYDPETIDRFGPLFLDAYDRATANAALSAGATPTVGTVQNYFSAGRSSDWTQAAIPANGADLLVFSLATRVDYNGEPWDVTWAGLPLAQMVTDRGHRMTKVYACPVPSGVTSGDFNVKLRGANGTATEGTEFSLTVIPLSSVRPGLSGDDSWRGANSDNSASISLSPVAKTGDLVLAIGGAYGTSGGGTFNAGTVVQTTTGDPNYTVTLSHQIAATDGPVTLTHTLGASCPFHSAQAFCLRPT